MIDVLQNAIVHLGVSEIPGTEANNETIMEYSRALGLEEWIHDDETPWCSAFVNFVAWILRLPRSKSLLARSWLRIGIPVKLHDARAENDIVILQRGAEPQPGPHIIQAPGHVGFFAGVESDDVMLLGGNQNNEVNISYYPIHKILGIRRLA